MTTPEPVDLGDLTIVMSKTPDNEDARIIELAIAELTASREEIERLTGEEEKWEDAAAARVAECVAALQAAEAKTQAQAEEIEKLHEALNGQLETIRAKDESIRRLVEGLKRMLDQPNESASDTKVLREIVRIGRSLLASLPEDGSPT